MGKTNQPLETNSGLRKECKERDGKTKNNNNKEKQNSQAVVDLAREVSSSPLLYLFLRGIPATCPNAAPRFQWEGESLQSPAKKRAPSALGTREPTVSWHRVLRRNCCFISRQSTKQPRGIKLINCTPDKDPLYPICESLRHRGPQLAC